MVSAEPSGSSATPRRAYDIAIVPGDGIGPEVAAATVGILRQALDGRVDVRFRDHPAGAGCFLETGTAVPEATLAACRAADAVLHGAAGLPGILHADGTEAGQDFSMRIRAALDLYANVRPIRLMAGAPRRLREAGPGDIDFTIVRENTEGLYAARNGGNLLRGELATDTMVITRRGVERIVRRAAEIARAGGGAPADGVKRVSIVDKANVLRSYAFFRETADAVLAEFPEIEVEHVIVDAMTVHMLERPAHFDVVVCENLIGDILSDLGAAMMGGMGLAPSSETGDRHGMFQGSHGSAPAIAGQDVANPMACILSGARMLDWLAEQHQDDRLAAAAGRIVRAVETVLADGRQVTSDIGGSASTTACAAAVCDALVLSEEHD